MMVAFVFALEFGKKLRYFADEEKQRTINSFIAAEVHIWHIAAVQLEKCGKSGLSRGGVRLGAGQS